MIYVIAFLLHGKFVWEWFAFNVALYFIFTET